MLSFAAISLACETNLAIALRVGLAATPAAVQSLVPHTISQAKADIIKRDTNDGVQAAIRCNDCIKAIPGGKSSVERRVAKARCYSALAVDVRAIAGRHNLGGHPIIDSILVFFNSTADALEEYCRAVNCDAAGEQMDAAFADNPDKELERRLKLCLRDLKRGTEH